MEAFLIQWGPGIVKGLSAAASLGSIATRVAPFFRSASRHREIIAALDKIRPKKGEYSEFDVAEGAFQAQVNKQEWDAVLRWLDLGDALRQPVQARLIRRLLFLALLLGGAIAATAIRLPGTSELIPGSQLEWPDLAVLLGTAITSWLPAFRAWLISSQEETFFHNLAGLEEEFYRIEVSPRINAFNRVVGRRYSGFAQGADRDLQSLESQIATIRKQLASAMRKPDPLPSAKDSGSADSRKEP